MSGPPITRDPSSAAQVVLDVPAEMHSLRLLRLAVADAAATQDFPADRIDRARVAVDELTAVLLTASQAPRLVVVITRYPGAVEIDGCIDHESSTVPTVDDVVVELLDMCTAQDSWRLWIEDHTLQFRVGIPRD
jgi:hypothetical protein